MSYIPNELYKTLVRELPIACIDVVIACDNKFLLVKRVQDPLSGQYWLPGGRLFIGERISEAVSRIVFKELGVALSNDQDMRFLGVTNMIFSESSWGTHIYHTPATIIKISLDAKPNICLDCSSSDYIWSDSLPSLLTNQLIYTDSHV